MSSANEHILPSVVHPPTAPSSKQRISPLEYRNTDLVSRLLAATPPYLYNMSILPNTYFFSEMLRSFVQAKAQENRSCTTVNSLSQNSNLHSRRRKRNWSGNPPPPPPPPRCEWQQKSNKVQATEKFEDTGNNNNNSENWSKVPNFGNAKVYENPRHIENNPLELTMSSKDNEGKQTTDEMNTSSRVQPPSHLLLPSPNVAPSSSYLPSSSGVNSSTSTCSTSTPSTSQSSTIFQQNLSESPNMLHLPPPPPMWYPPLYPTAPYAIDPLHFFIDLRVSGHIYDRKNRDFQIKESKNENTQKEADNLINLKEEENEDHHDILNRNRHISAFSVPNPNKAINLSPPKTDVLNKNSKRFDVNSMLYNKSCNNNKYSTNYIMSNIKNIYENIDVLKKDNVDDCKKHIQNDSEEDRLEKTLKSDDLDRTRDNDSVNVDEDDDEKERERKKKMKDLRALIGLELVVDYMNYTKPNQKNNLDETSEEIEIMEDSKSPTVEVVDVPEDI